MTITFRQLLDEVMTQREKDGVRGHDRELSRVRCHIATAHFADKLVTDVTAPDIREWLRWMQDRDTRGTGAVRKLSRQTINRCQSLVSAVFVEAVEREIIAQNICIGVKPKKRVDERDTVEKWAFLTLEEQRAIASCDAIPCADRLIMRFAIGTGLRQGEQHHLELQDLVVDGQEPHVVVRYGSRSKTGKKLPPKSGKKRVVPLFGDGLAAAREWLTLLPSYCSENPEGLVFPTEGGAIRQQGKTLGRSDSFKRRLAAAGITRRVRWHDLRHTCATSLITGLWGRAWTLAEIQRVMGHSSSQVTERYSHLGDDAIKLAARETAIEPMPAPIAIVSVPTPAVRPIEGFAARLASLAFALGARLKEAGSAA
jgi:integrase